MSYFGRWFFCCCSRQCFLNPWSSPDGCLRYSLVPYLRWLAWPCLPIVNRQSSIVDRQSINRSIVNRQSSIVNRQSSIVNRQSSTVNRQSSIVNRFDEGISDRIHIAAASIYLISFGWMRRRVSVKARVSSIVAACPRLCSSDYIQNTILEYKTVTWHRCWCPLIT